MIAIYARVSTEEQAKHGYSIEHQIDKCTKEIYKDYPNNEVKIMEYIDSGVSGEFIERPALINLRQVVRAEVITAIYCYDPDRLSRTLMHQLILADEFDQNTKLLFVNGEYEKTPEGRLFYQMRGAVAEFEKAKINERMINGRKTKASKGKVVKNYHIYGYDYNRETGKLIINEEEAKIVRFIFNTFVGKNNQFKGINGIAMYLTETKVPTKKGKGIWHRQVVRQILMNKAYIGEFYQNKWNTEGMLGNKFKSNSEDKIKTTIRPQEEWILVPCVKIIDEVVFDQAQKLLQVSRQRWSGTSKNQYLLSGLVRCSKCGNTMTGRRKKNWGKYVFEYSCVKNTAGAKNKGCGNIIRCEVLDEQVWNVFYDWLSDYKDFKEEKEVEIASFEESEIIRIQTLINEKELGRKQFIKSMLDGKILGLSDFEISQGLKESQETIDSLKKQLNYLENELNKEKYSKDKINLLAVSLEEYLLKAPEELTFEDKKEMLRHVIREIQVEDNEHVKILGL